MSSVGILAWKSALQDGTPVVMPDFKKESSRRQFENDHWSPWPDGTGNGRAPSSILGPVKLDAKALARARKEWKKMGYTGE